MHKHFRRFLILTCFCLAVFAVSFASAMTADEKADAIVAEMRAAGITDPYDQAVWLHDWLTHNANYDYTFVHSEPEGVLLLGTGVCQSYTDAYAMLLSRVSIQSQIVASDEMDHTWNLVLLNGTWCHVDVTWDDPEEGGQESHFYFGMSDALISRDHTWNTSPALPACSSKENYYLIRHPEGIVFSSAEEMASRLEEVIADKPQKISLFYAGESNDFDIESEFAAWFGSVNWKYGLMDFYGPYDAFTADYEIEYTEPWEKPVNKLETPVAAPDFAIRGPAGTYRLSAYSGNGLVLVFGRNGCYNTESFLNSFAPQVERLRQNGVEVLVCIEDAAGVEDILPMEEKIPGYTYLYDQNLLLGKYIRAVGLDSSQTFYYPFLFIINPSGQITYYFTGYVSNLPEVSSEAFATATGKELPAPEETNYQEMQNGNGNVLSLTGLEMIHGVQSAFGNAQYIYFIYDHALQSSPAKSVLQTWEGKHELYESLGIRLVASIVNAADAEKAAYPHTTFIPYVTDDFWALLHNAGYPAATSASTTGSYFYAPSGRCLSYTNGNLLSLDSCAMMLTENLSYDLRLPSGLTRLEEEAFAGTSFINADLTAGSLTEIGSGAFAGCSGLRFVRIPRSVTLIGEGAFSSCPNLIIICPGNSEACRFAIREGLTYLNP